MAVITLRALENHDIDAVSALYTRAVRSCCAPFYTKIQIDAWAPLPIDPTYWIDSFAQVQAIVAVSKNGEIMGFADLDRVKPMIGRLYVDPVWQGFGVGTALLNAMELRLRQQGQSYVELESALNAKSFYLNRGYEYRGSTTLAFNGVLFENLRMHKLF